MDTGPTKKVNIVIVQGGRWIGNYGRTSHLRSHTSEIKLSIDDKQIFDFHLNNYSGNHDLQLAVGRHKYEFVAHIDLAGGNIDDHCTGSIDIEKDMKFAPEIAFNDNSIRTCNLQPVN